MAQLSESYEERSYECNITTIPRDFPIETGGMMTNLLCGHDEESMHDARMAVDLLQQYKEKCHEFTSAIVDFWPLPREEMERYQVNDVEELNEWENICPIK
ncbi:MAG: hypothetical protein GQ532_04045 [Methylomarinum sp.]|nr:hypothetical protein [Methylomarinum sp.]